MSATEIVLIVIGAVVFLLGYLMPVRRKDTDEEVQLISEDEIRKLVASETERVKDQVEDIVEETISYSMERAERAMERLSNEKIMAINEYSDTVLEEINKNHKEVVFLYDMLNDKHDNLMSTINEATVAADEIKQTVQDAEVTAAEVADRIDVVLQAADDAADMVKDAEDAIAQAQGVIRLTQRTAEKTEVQGLEPQRPEAQRTEGQRSVQDEERATVLVREDEPVLADVSEIIGGRTYTDDFENMQDREQKRAGEIPGIEELEEIEEASDAGNGYEDGVDFGPIMPRRVEIIHQPDRDYVVGEPDDISTSEAFASMGFFAPGMDEPERPDRKTRTRRSFRRARAQENAASMDIQFAQGNNNGRNSNERILELHKAGKSNMAIAKELGLGLGEVKLVIDLFEGAQGGQ